MNPQAKTKLILIAAAALLAFGAVITLGAPNKHQLFTPAAGVAAPRDLTPAPQPIAMQPQPVDAFAEAVKLAGSDLVKVEPALSHPVVLAGGRRELYLKADVSTNAPPSPAAARAPVQLALVIDCSGSMDGPKIESTRAAAREVLKQLQDGDRLTLVSYETRARVLLSSRAVNEGSRAMALAAIERLRAEGSTNLGAGVDLGAKMLLADREADHSVRRMVLLSDGQANVGETRLETLFATAADLRNRGIGLSTIGVGVDFNAQLMEGLAEHGGGRFRFLEDPTEIALAFVKELRLAATLVAGDVKVVLHPADGVRIEEVYGQLWDRLGNDVVVRLPDLASTTQVRVLARLTVDASRSEVPVVEAAATFADVVSDRARAVARSASLSVRTTNSVSEVTQQANREVLTYAINGKGIADARRAIELYNQGRREEALASLDRASSTVAVYNKDLHATELKTSGSIFGNLRSLFAASANALGGSEDNALAQRKAIKNFGANNMAAE